jgi:hypothetical protein
MKAYLLMGLFAILFGSKASAAQPDVELKPLPAMQLREINEKAIAGAALLEKYLRTGPEYTPNQVDDAIARWSRATSKNKESPEQVIELIGAYFGNYLVQKLELEWKVYHDDRGSDLCVIHKKVWVFSFPHSAIYKAVKQGRQHALTEVESTLRAQIAERLRDPSVMPR